MPTEPFYLGDDAELVRRLREYFEGSNKRLFYDVKNRLCTVTRESVVEALDPLSIQRTVTTQIMSYSGAELTGKLYKDGTPKRLEISYRRTLAIFDLLSQAIPRLLVDTTKDPTGINTDDLFGGI